MHLSNSILSPSLPSFLSPSPPASFLPISLILPHSLSLYLTFLSIQFSKDTTQQFYYLAFFSFSTTLFLNAPKRYKIKERKEEGESGKNWEKNEVRVKKKMKKRENEIEGGGGNVGGEVEEIGKIYKNAL